MGNEYPLKTMVIGLENLAKDNEALCRFMVLRAQHYGWKGKFKPAEHEPPTPKYKSIKESQERAADLVTKIADNNARAVISMKREPSDPAPLDPDKYSETDLLRIMMDWGLLQAGIQKTMLQLFGQSAGAPHEHVSPGAASETRLWCEIVSWLEKIAVDSENHYITQRTPKRKSKAVTEKHPLIRMELGIHRVTLDLLEMASRLPYHLHHAAHNRWGE